MTASILKSAGPSALPKVIVKYYLHCNGQDASVLAGSSVLSWESICPLLESCPSWNLFQQFFSIEFNHKDHICPGYIQLRICTLFWSGWQHSISNVSRTVQIWTQRRHAWTYIVLAVWACPLTSLVPARCKQQNLFAQSVSSSCHHNSDIGQWHHLPLPSLEGAMGPGVHKQHWIVHSLGSHAEPIQNQQQSLSQRQP